VRRSLELQVGDLLPRRQKLGALVRHDVDFSIPSRDLGRADVEFNVWQDGLKHGTLRISKGSVVWFPKNNSWGFKIGWTKFDVLLKENGTRLEKR
jgi:hypothetical protein